LFRIAHNALVDHYRRKRNKAEPFHEEVSPSTDDQDGPAESLLGKMDRLELSRLLAELKDDYRMVLVLRFLNQLSPAETAAAMQRSTGAVRVLQHRALAALRKRIPDKKAD
jgi:RNA polymerase sigma-70 factor (ECF subfamily)